MEFTLYQLFWYFVIYSVLGWCVEVVFCSVTTGHWVNRGFLNGPVCPIYGFGMCIVLLCLTPLQNSLFLLFIGSFVLTSALELVTGFVLKTIFPTTWWDYSDQPFNLGGYVCLKFSLAWGLGGCAAVRMLHPPIATLVAITPRRLGLVVAGLAAILLLTDFIVTLTTLLGLRRDLRELEAVAAALHKSSEAISCNLGQAALAADSVLTSQRTELEARIPALEARRDLLRARLLDTRLLGAGRLMKAFPRVHAVRHPETLAQLKAELREKLHR